jgi:A1 cistron-splicing factor AAR2
MVPQVARRSSMGTDDTFFAPVQIRQSHDRTSQGDELSSRPDTPFNRNLVSVQRNPSIAKSIQVESSLSRQLSVRTNGSGSYDAELSQSSILGVLSLGHNNDIEGVTEGIGECRLTKSSSCHSNKSFATIKSVQSMAALGAFPLGSLRVHSDNNLEQLSQVPECMDSGDVIIVTGIPPGSFFGFDTVGMNIGKDGHFDGIRDLPAGAHFIFGGSSSVASTRTGFWIMSDQRASGVRGEIHVKRWDKYSETLAEEISQAEIRIQKENVPNVFNRLMPYQPTSTSLGSINLGQEPQLLTKDMGTAKDPIMWHRLTSAIKGAMLTRITSHGWNNWQITSTDDYKPMGYKPTDSRNDSSMKVAQESLDRLEQLTSKDRVLSFAFPQSAHTFSENVTGRQRTEQAMDTSAHIMAVITDRCTFEDEDEVIGELQFCFITGMLLGNMACIEQWGHIVKVVFKAFRLSMDKPVFFRKIVEAIHAQLTYNEDGLEGSVFGKQYSIYQKWEEKLTLQTIDYDGNLENDLKLILTIFKSRLNEQLLGRGASLTDEQSSVGKAFEDLESWLWKWGWDLRGNYLRSGKIQLEDGEFVDAELGDFEQEDERGEYAPVIVDLEADGTEKGLLRW